MGSYCRGDGFGLLIGRRETWSVFLVLGLDLGEIGMFEGVASRNTVFRVVGEKELQQLKQFSRAVRQKGLQS